MSVNRYLVTVVFKNGSTYSLLFRNFDVDQAMKDIEDIEAAGTYYIFASDLYNVKTVYALRKKEIDVVYKEPVEQNA